MQTTDAPPTAVPASQTALRNSVLPFLSFYGGPIYRHLSDPGAANFAFGNPNEMPLPGYVSALHEHLDPQNP
jgi:hypothetical protein